MSLTIGPETTVGALLTAFPELEGVLIDMASAFAKLRNPVVRRTVAKVAKLEQVATIGGVNLQGDDSQTPRRCWCGWTRRAESAAGLAARL
jgi:hypothetical protein